MNKRKEKETMLFEEARAELKKLATGRYRSLYYDLTENESSILEQRCRVYIDPGISSKQCGTWEEAPDDVAVKLNPGAEEPIEVCGAPKDDSKAPAVVEKEEKYERQLAYR